MDRRWHFLLFLLCFALPAGVFLVSGLLAWRNRASDLPAFSFLGNTSHAPSSAPSFAAQRDRNFLRRPSQGFSAWDENRLLDLARSGEACALLESPLTARAPLLALYRLFPATDAAALPPEVIEAYLMALSARNGADFEAALRSASHPLLDLTEAERLLGLLPNHAAAGDPRAALPGLRALSEQDALNAAPSLLLAYALRRAGEPEESAAELERALARPTFRLYADEAMRSLYQRARDKPALLSAAVAIGARAPGPDLFPLEDFVLEALAEADPRVAELAYNFGRRLAALERDDLVVTALNFGFGQRVAATAWRKLHPAQKAPRALADRPVPVGQRAGSGLLAGLRLPLARGACEKELPRLAERLQAEPPVALNRAPAL